jgi:hypothetical protein
VSVKLRTAISKASSNSWLTAAGRWASASDRHSQSCLQTFFSFFLFLWCDNNRTRIGSWKIKFNLNLGFLFCFCCFVVCFFYFVFWFFPLWWDNDRTTSETLSPGLEAEGLTPKLLRLKLYCIWTLGFFFLILCLSNACSAYHWLVHYLSLFISLAFFLLLFFQLLVFPFFFTFFTFSLLSPFHSRYHHCYYYKLDNTELHTVQRQ